MLLTGCTGLEEDIKLPFTEHFVPGTVLSTLKITLAFKNCSTLKLEFLINSTVVLILQMRKEVQRGQLRRTNFDDNSKNSASRNDLNFYHTFVFEVYNNFVSVKLRNNFKVFINKRNKLHHQKLKLPWVHLFSNFSSKCTI